METAAWIFFTGTFLCLMKSLNLSLRARHQADSPVYRDSLRDRARGFVVAAISLLLIGVLLVVPLP